MSARAIPQTPTEPALPSETDVVVIGGGVAGVCAALELARAGERVVLLEKGRIAGEQSSRNWGWIRVQGRDMAEMPLMLEAARLWPRLARDCGKDTGLATCSTTYLALNEDDLAARAAWLDDAKTYQVDTRILSARETDALLGRDDRRFTGALHTPSDQTAEPRLAVPALARLAAREGVIIREGCAARTLELIGGRVAGVATERGRVRCTRVVLAAGAWSRTFLENHALHIPQLAVRSTALRTTPAREVHPGGLGAGPASLRRRADGGYTIGRTNAARFDLVPAAFRHLRAFLPVLARRWRTTKVRAGRSYFGPLGRHRWEGDEVSPFEAVRVMDPTPDAILARRMLTSAIALHPALEGTKVAETWAGLIDVTPDEVPIIAPLGPPGLVVVTGLSGHGFGLGPGAGRLAADLALARAPIVDPTPFDPARFARTGRAVAA